MNFIELKMRLQDVVVVPSRMGKRYSNDYSDEQLRKQADDLENAVTIPVNVEIKADHKVLDLSEVEGYLKKSEEDRSSKLRLSR